MRIVSQCRCISVDFASAMIGIDENSIRVRTLNGATIDNKIIGIYYTAERAHEVFEDIHYAYNPLNRLLNIKTGQHYDNKKEPLTSITNNTNEKIILNNNFVYYMPEE